MDRFLHPCHLQFVVRNAREADIILVYTDLIGTWDTDLHVNECMNHKFIKPPWNDVVHGLVRA